MCWTVTLTTNPYPSSSSFLLGILCESAEAAAAFFPIVSIVLRAHTLFSDTLS